MGREKGDYSRVDEYLEDIDSDIEFEYGEKYDDLSRADRRQALLDHFFKGRPEYYRSAEKLRDGIDYARGTGDFGVRVDTIHRRGRDYTVIRDTETGRIRQWVRD